MPITIQIQVLMIIKNVIVLGIGCLWNDSPHVFNRKAITDRNESINNFIFAVALIIYLLLSYSLMKKFLALHIYTLSRYVKRLQQREK